MTIERPATRSRRESITGLPSQLPWGILPALVDRVAAHELATLRVRDYTPERRHPACPTTARQIVFC